MAPIASGKYPGPMRKAEPIGYWTATPIASAPNATKINPAPASLVLRIFRTTPESPFASP